MVNTEQLAQGQGSWEDAQQQGFVAKEGARVTTNVMVRDMDLEAPNPGDARRLEIVADASVWELAVDTTLISTLHCDGSARPGTADTDGAASGAARRWKERTYTDRLNI